MYDFRRISLHQAQHVGASSQVLQQVNHLL
jgi:hypothetical protein